MTAPVPHGYPDFGRFIAGADKLVTSVTDNNLAAPANYGPFFVGDIPFVRFYFRAFIRNFDVVYNFYEDEAQTILLGTESFVVRVLGFYDQATPALGPFVTITVSPSAAGGSFDMRVVAAHTQWRPGDASPLTSVPFSGSAVAYPAGITDLDDPYVVPGPAVFFAECLTANTQIDLRAVNSAGTSTFLARIANPDGRVAMPVFLPRMPLRLRIDNNSGGGANFTYSVMRQYGGVQ